MLVANLRATLDQYPAALQRVMSIGKADESRSWLADWPLISGGATPLYYLPDTAAAVGVAEVIVKDESERSVLGSFKALGAPIALVRLILREFPAQRFEARGLLAGKYRGALGNFTVVSATDGNHGRALAAAAQSVGCRCVIVLHANVSNEREDAIAAYGADIVRISGNYDDSVQEAAALAHTNGWLVVSDTSYDGYEEIPRDVMQGYGIISAEVTEVLGQGITHVFLQGGVGGLAAGVASYLWELYGAERPTFVVVEPVQADCLYQSAISGQAAMATGSVDSVMAGLACGATSPLAWKFLDSCIDFFMTIDDDEAIDAMRHLARGSALDIAVVSGESGAAGMAGLLRLATNTVLAKQVGLTGESRVLLINTEGATAPEVYRTLVGESAEFVLARQRARL